MDDKALAQLTEVLGGLSADQLRAIRDVLSDLERDAGGPNSKSVEISVPAADMKLKTGTVEFSVDAGFEVDATYHRPVPADIQSPLEKIARWVRVASDIARVIDLITRLLG